MSTDFQDVLEANRAYAREFELGGLAAQARRELAVLTCIDSRIEPLSMLGLQPGDAKIVRNAGARVTDDALRSLVLASAMLGVRRIMVVQHTDCAMTNASDEELREAVAARAAGDVDVEAFEPWAMTEPHATLAADVERLRSSGLLPAGVEVAGFEYDVATGLLAPVVQ